jgi:glycosyltransferase involved in cell wall biosynthesis
MTKIKKILLISALFPPEPVVSANISKDIANALSLEHKVTVISPPPSRPMGFKFSDLSNKSGFKHIVSNTYVCAPSKLLGRIKESYSFGRYCFRYILRNRSLIDVVYANTWPMFAQYFVVKAAKVSGIPVVIHIQDIYPESIANRAKYLGELIVKLVKPLDRYILFNSDKVIAISIGMRKYLSNTRGIEEDKFVIVQNWQDETHFPQTSKREKRGQKAHKIFTFMYLGNIGPLAGIDLLINSFVLAGVEDSRLIVAGSGSMKQSLMHQVQAQAYNNIEFWEVPSKKVAEIQTFADVMLLPMREGAGKNSVPSKLPAYMFSAKPVIASVDSDSDIATAVRDAACGWVITPENSQEMAKYFHIASKTARLKLDLLGSNGHAYAQRNYSRSSNMSRVVKLINEVTSH